MTLIPLEPQLSILKYQPGTPVPQWALSGDIYSVARTPEELSIVVEDRFIPSKGDADAGDSGLVARDHGWKGFAVKGPLDFGLTGILASIAVPLGDEGVSIFAISTYDTDIILVKEDMFDRAKSCLTKKGFHWM